MIVEDDFFPDPKVHPHAITVADLCERFTAAGLPCRFEQLDNEVRVFFEDRKSNLIFMVNAAGRPLSACMGDDSDYDAEFAGVLFDVFESIGWTFAPGLDDDDTDLIDAEAK